MVLGRHPQVLRLNQSPLHTDTVPVSRVWTAGEGWTSAVQVKSWLRLTAQFLGLYIFVPELV